MTDGSARCKFSIHDWVRDSPWYLLAHAMRLLDSEKGYKCITKSSSEGDVRLGKKKLCMV
jgi:hypothetical protein